MMDLLYDIRMADPVALSIENCIARLVLQRPGGNALTGAMIAQLAALFARAAAEADVLVISSTEDDFSIGRDRQEPKGSGTPFDAFRTITETNAALGAFPGIVVSLVRGRAFGFSVGMVMRSDIAIAGDNACFALDEVKLGIAPMFIMSEILEHLAPKAALDIIMTSREFGAEEAQRMGVVSRVVPATKLEAAGHELVSELASRNPAVLRDSKRYLAAVRQLPLAARGAFALAEQTKYATRQH